MTQFADAEYIKSHTGFSDITLLESVDSTNKYLKRYAHEKKEGAVVIAKTQSSGRGRLGRTFHSPENGLYMSVLIDVSLFWSEELIKITGVAAVALTRTIEHFTDIKPQIKWVNDIYFSGKKVCGILAETSFSIEGKPEYCVLGIGVNLFEPQNGFDKSIEDIAGSVFGEKNDRISINEFSSHLINELFALLKKDCTKEYGSHLMLMGKTVRYTLNGHEAEGTVIGIDSLFGLIVETNGKKTVLRSGEAELIKQNYE